MFVLLYAKRSAFFAPVDNTSTIFILEVRADDTPAILAVLNADKKRLELIEQEKTLTAEYEKGSTEAGNKLKEVCVVV